MKKEDPFRILRELQNEAVRLRKELRDIEPKRQRLAAIETRLREAAAILKGEPIAKPKSRHGFVGGKRAKPIQHGSSVWWTAKVLHMLGRPTHITQLLPRINRESGESFKASTLVSNLSRYVKFGDTFERPAPNTFGLIDFTKDPVAEGVLFDEFASDEEREESK
jgi:hypothetical protein